MTHGRRLAVAGQSAAPYALLCVALSAGLFLSWRANRGNSASGAGLSFALSVVATFLAFLAALGSGFSMVHGATANLDGRTYHLAFQPGLDRDDKCILLECDGMDLLCVVRRTSVRYMVNPERTKLVTDARAHAVYVQLGDEIVTSYAPASRGN